MSEWYAADNLHRCWLTVRQKGARGGIDKVSLEDYHRKLTSRLKKLSRVLRQKKYVPDPYMRFHLKKSAGGRRAICLTTIEDKIVQTAVKNKIEPLFESHFLPCSYAYRPGRGHRKAIHNVNHFIGQKLHWAATCDIDNFFDDINHELLLKMLGERIGGDYVLELIRLWLKTGAFSGDRYREARAGVPQGGIISPLLSNIYLHPFDLQMKKRGAHYIRYADDFIILEKTEKTAREHFIFSEKFLQNELFLRLNKKEEPLCRLADGFVYLGIYFTEGKRTMAPGKLRKAIGKIDKIFEKAPKRPFSETITKVNEAASAWQYYYGECDNSRPFESIQKRIFEKLAGYVCTISEKGQMPERDYLKSNLKRLQLLMPLEAADKKRLYRRILSGQGKMETESAAMKKDKKKKNAPPGKKDVRRAVQARKRKYQRFFSSEYDLVLSGYGSFVGRRLKRLVVKKKNGKSREFAVSKVKHILVLNKSVTFSSAAIQLCGRNGVTLDFLDYTGKPYARLSSPEMPAWRYGLYQVEARHNGRAAELAKAFVEGKIRNQANLMKYFAKYRKKRDKKFMKLFCCEIDLIKSYLAEIDTLKDTLPLKDIQGKLLGIEGRAAAAYWRLVRCLVESRVEFRRREHQGAGDIFNSLLNYGYGILYARVWGALMRAGLDVQIGFLHCPQYEKPTLVYDLVEEFRAQVVDRVIISLISRGEKMSVDKKGYLVKESKDKLVENIFERLHTPLKFRKKQRTLQEIIQYQARAIGKFLKEGRPVYSPFIAKW